MKLIIILICIGVQRYLHMANQWHELPWFSRYLSRLQGWFSGKSWWRGYLAMLVMVLPLPLLIAVIACLMGSWLYGLVGLVFSVLVLLLCLDSRDFKNQLVAYFNASDKQDMESAYEYAIEFVGDDCADNAAAMAREVTKTIFLKSSQRVFSVLFWFVILGPLGAMLFFVTNQLATLARAEDSEFNFISQPTDTFLSLLEWIPVRLLAFSFALVGHFKPTMQWLWQHKTDGLSATQDMVCQAGFTALAIDSENTQTASVTENHDALDLVFHAGVAWLVVIAILTLTAWIA